MDGAQGVSVGAVLRLGTVPKEGFVGTLKRLSGGGELMADFVGVFVVQSGPMPEAKDCEACEEKSEKTRMKK